MNNFYSRPGTYLPRWLTSHLRQATQDHPVVVLTGARQVGKSTLLRSAEPFASWRFRTMDDYDTLRQAQEDPQGLWAGATEVVLDEVQKAPGLLPAIKQAVDQQPGRHRFMLSGSANLLLLNQVSESLAGRAVYFVLYPMTCGELHQAPPTDLLDRLLGGQQPAEGIIDAPPDPASVLIQGFMPALLTLPSLDARIRWWNGYVAAYLERDLRQLSQIDNLVDFRRVMELLALRTGQLLNTSEVARDAQVSQSTAHRYANLLQATHLFERLPAYTKSHSQRLVKSPKAFWSDPALAIFLAGYYDEDSLREAKELGAFFEAMIYHHLRVLVELQTPPARLYFWRARDGQEVDFVVEHGRRLMGIEVKMSTRVNYGDTESLRRFLGDQPDASGGLILYGGREIRRISERISAVPWTLLTG